MGVSGLVSQGSRAARMFVQMAELAPSRENNVPRLHSPARTRRAPVGADTVGVPGDWGYRWVI